MEATKHGELALRKTDPYYALCTKNEEGEEEIAPLFLERDEELGTLLGIAVYTALHGNAQQDDLKRWEGETRIASVSREDLLDAMNRIYPTSVFLDGKKFAGSVFKGMIKGELGLPIKHPRGLRIDTTDE